MYDHYNWDVDMLNFYGRVTCIYNYNYIYIRYVLIFDVALSSSDSLSPISFPKVLFSECSAVNRIHKTSIFIVSFSHSKW